MAFEAKDYSDETSVDSRTVTDGNRPSKRYPDVTRPLLPPAKSLIGGVPAPSNFDGQSIEQLAKFSDNRLWGIDPFKGYAVIQYRLARMHLFRTYLLLVAGGILALIWGTLVLVQSGALLHGISSSNSILLVKVVETVALVASTLFVASFIANMAGLCKRHNSANDLVKVLKEKGDISLDSGRVVVMSDKLSDTELRLLNHALINSKHLRGYRVVRACDIIDGIGSWICFISQILTVGSVLGAYSFNTTSIKVGCFSGQGIGDVTGNVVFSTAAVVLAIYVLVKYTLQRFSKSNTKYTDGVYVAPRTASEYKTKVIGGLREARKRSSEFTGADVVIYTVLALAMILIFVGKVLVVLEGSNCLTYGAEVSEGFGMPVTPVGFVLRTIGAVLFFCVLIYVVFGRKSSVGQWKDFDLEVIVPEEAEQELLGDKGDSFPLQTYNDNSRFGTMVGGIANDETVLNDSYLGDVPHDSTAPHDLASPSASTVGQGEEQRLS